MRNDKSLKNIESFLRAGLPIITDWTDYKSGDGHYTVITEVKSKEMVFCDPWYGPKYSVERKIFEKYWDDNLTRRKKWIMAVLPKCTKVRQEIEMKINGKNIMVKAGRVYNA